MATSPQSWDEAVKLARPIGSDPVAPSPASPAQDQGSATPASWDDALRQARPIGQPAPKIRTTYVGSPSIELPPEQADAPAPDGKPTTWKAALEAVKPIATTNAVTALGGGTMTDIWNRAGQSAKSLIESTLGESWDQTRKNLPAPAKTAEFLYHASKAI